MKYAFNTWCYGSFPTWLPAYPLDDVIRRLARIGYDGIEIGCASPHAWPDFLSADARKSIAQTLKSNKLAVSSMLPAPGGGPGNNPASAIAEERTWTRKHYKDVVDLASDLECPRVLYIAGWQIFGVTTDDAWKWSLECLVDVAEHAKSKGVTIAVEPTPADSNLIETADDALSLMKQAGQSNVKVMFDTIHALYRNEDPSDYVHRMKDHLDHIHMSDYDRLAPGAGGMDFRPVMQALKDIGFDGYVTMEIGFAARSTHPDSIARGALDHLKGIESSL